MVEEPLTRTISVAKKLVEELLIVMRFWIVAEATVRSEMVVVARVEVPVTINRLDTVDVPARRSMKLPFSVPKLVVKKLVVVALSTKTLRAYKLVVVAFVDDAFVVTNLVVVAKEMVALVEKRLVDEARVLKSVVVVLLVITDDDARRVPVSATVLTADR